MHFTKSYIRKVIKEELKKVVEVRDDPDHDDGEAGRDPTEPGLEAALERYRKRRAASTEDTTQYIQGDPSKTKRGFDYTSKKKAFQEDDSAPALGGGKVSTSQGRTTGIEGSKEQARMSGISPDETGMIQDLNKLLVRAAAEGRIDQGKVDKAINVLAGLLLPIAGNAKVTDTTELTDISEHRKRKRKRK